MQAAEKLALRDPPPLSARPTKKPSGMVSGLSGRVEVGRVSFISGVRRRTAPGASGGTTWAKVAARVRFLARDSYGIRLLLSGTFTDVSRSEHPAASTAASSTATPPVVPPAARRPSFHAMPAIVGRNDKDGYPEYHHDPLDRLRMDR